VQSSGVCVEVGEGHSGMGGICVGGARMVAFVWACGRGSSAGECGHRHRHGSGRATEIVQCTKQTLEIVEWQNGGRQATLIVLI
jgi:hypothetical protein